MISYNQLPDPYDEPDVQTYISLWQEKEYHNLDDCIKDCEEGEQVSPLMPDR